jgi:hypothetical protein
VSTKAPDGLPWPPAYVGVDTREAVPFAFGFVPAPHTEGAPVHTYERAADEWSLVNTLLDGPWPTARVTLQTGDYQLLDGHGVPLPPERSPCIERKAPGDLVGSLTAGHDRFIDAEMPRLAAWRCPVVVAEAPIEWLLGARSVPIAALFQLRKYAGGLLDQWEEEGPRLREDAVMGEPGYAGNFTYAREQLRQLDGILSGCRYERDAHRSQGKVRAMLGSLLSIFCDHRVLPLCLPDRRWAEYASGWILRRGWRRWLTEEWAAGRRESVEAVRAQRATWAEPWRPEVVAGAEAEAPRVKLAPAGGMCASSSEAAGRKIAARRAAREDAA